MLSNIYIGLVVNNKDPRKKGRVQVFIPHITNTLYTGWNEKNENIKFRTLDPSVFTPEITQRLIDVLPWAEVSMPFFGGGTGAPVNTYTGEFETAPTSPTSGGTSSDDIVLPKSVTVPKENGLNSHTGNVTSESVEINSQKVEINNPNPYGLSDNEILYMMRIAANETGAGTSASANYVYNEISDYKKAVNYSGDNAKNKDGSVNLQGVDIGFAQNNGENVKKFGFVNSGSYYDQITGSALALRSYLTARENTKDLRDGVKISNAIKSKDFATADRLLSNFYFALDENKENYANAASLEEKIKTKYKGSVIAALKGIDGELKPTGDINQIASTTPAADNMVASGRNVSKTTTLLNGNSFYGRIDVSNQGASMGISSVPHIGSKAYVMFLDGNHLQPIVIGCFREPSNG